MDLLILSHRVEEAALLLKIHQLRQDIIINNRASSSSNHVKIEVVCSSRSVPTTTSSTMEDAQDTTMPSSIVDALMELCRTMKDQGRKLRWSFYVTTTAHTSSDARCTRSSCSRTTYCNRSEGQKPMQERPWWERVLLVADQECGILEHLTITTGLKEQRFAPLLDIVSSSKTLTSLNAVHLTSLSTTTPTATIAGDHPTNDTGSSAVDITALPSSCWLTKALQSNQSLRSVVLNISTEAHLSWIHALQNHPTLEELRIYCSSKRHLNQVTTAVSRVLATTTGSLTTLDVSFTDSRRGLSSTRTPSKNSVFPMHELLKGLKQTTQLRSLTLCNVHLQNQEADALLYAIAEWKIPIQQLDLFGNHIQSLVFDRFAGFVQASPSCITTLETINLCQNPCTTGPHHHHATRKRKVISIFPKHPFQQCSPSSSSHDRHQQQEQQRASSSPSKIDEQRYLVHMLLTHPRIRELSGIACATTTKYGTSFQKQLQWMLDWNAVRGPEVVCQESTLHSGELFPHVLARVQRLYQKQQQQQEQEPPVSSQNRAPQGPSLLFQMLRETPVFGT